MGGDALPQLMSPQSVSGVPDSRSTVSIQPRAIGTQNLALVANGQEHARMAKWPVPTLAGDRMLVGIYDFGRLRHGRNHLADPVLTRRPDRLPVQPMIRQGGGNTTGQAST